MYQSFRDMLGDHLWARLCQLAPRQHRGSRTVLLSQDDPGTHVVVLESGSVIMTRTGPRGDQVILAVRGAGDLLGEQAVLDGGIRSCTVTTAEPCQVRVVLAADFRRFVTTHELHDLLLRHVISRIREGDEVRFELATAPVAPRLASALTRLAAGATQHRISLTQEELAQLIGASRNSVGQTIALWRTKGWLKTVAGGGLLLMDVAALQREADRG
jgi:CRP-like cAMP-binding protein